MPHGSGVDLLQVQIDHGFGSLLAQGQFDTDVFAGVRSAFNNFIQSGQVWALLVGIVLGYLIRGLTSY
ncbi:hypothetical protein [Leptolyngbya sp. AN02str]|uniref:hypothetical protein n=1 Tax=Leptolyngbya sp. AN02str TaxID=3423363 RepID=UPI003D323AB3